MALGRRNGERELWVAVASLPVSPGHAFSVKLNQMLAEAGFDEWIEGLCEPYYAKRSRPGILISAMAHNLGCLMRSLSGMSTPRGLLQIVDPLAELLCALDVPQIAPWRPLGRIWNHPASHIAFFNFNTNRPAPTAA
jgi:hypothetical protein